MAGTLLDPRLAVIILFTTTIVFFVAFIIMLFVYGVKTAELISPADCPIPLNTYAVSPATTGTASACGTTECVFQAASLQAAVNICNAQPTVCSQFTWSDLTGTMTFVTSPQPHPTVNVYTRPVVGPEAGGAAQQLLGRERGKPGYF